MKKIVVAGTGTDVGKTFVTGVILRHALEQGLSPRLCKPLQTGLERGDNDPETLSRKLPDLQRLPSEDEILFAFGYPAAPDLAGRLERRRVTVEEVSGRLKAVSVRNGGGLFVAELAGGVMVPLNESETNLDLMRALGWEVVLVTDAGLGMINHTLLSLKALAEGAVPVAGVIVNRYPRVPDVLAEDNVRVIERFAKVPVLALIEESEPFPALSEETRLSSFLRG